MRKKILYAAYILALCFLVGCVPAKDLLQVEEVEYEENIYSSYYEEEKAFYNYDGDFDKEESTSTNETKQEETNENVGKRATSNMPAYSKEELVELVKDEKYSEFLISYRDLTPDGVVLMVAFKNSANAQYSTVPRLNKQGDDGYSELMPQYNEYMKALQGDNAFGFVDLTNMEVVANEVYEMEVDFTEVYGELEAGEYDLIVTFNFFGEGDSVSVSGQNMPFSIVE